MSEATAYSQEIELQRRQRELRLLAKPTNWFTLVGLFPLKPGENSFGKGTNSSIALDLFPADLCGTLILDEDGCVLEPGKDLQLQVNGQPVNERVMLSENVAGPDLLEAGRLTMCIIRRGGEPYLRVWDRESPLLKNFPGLSYYPVDPAYCLQARYICYDCPQIHTLTNKIGNEYEACFAGELHFEIGGEKCRLLAEEDEDGLLLSFTDLTRLDATYPGGRYLWIPAPEGDTCVLDFNLAVNWPCAYTDFATCPVPPLENRLLVRIEAGERRFH